MHSRREESWRSSVIVLEDGSDKRRRAVLRDMAGHRLLGRADRDHGANCGGRIAELRPLIHQPPALFEKIAAAVGGFDLIADRMR